MTLKCPKQLDIQTVKLPKAVGYCDFIRGKGNLGSLRRITPKNYLPCNSNAWALMAYCFNL